jgi:hypothetical protein
MVLSHGGGIETSLSYQNVKLMFSVKTEAFAMPPQHLIRNLMTRMDAMQAEITELKQQISRDKLEAGLNNGEDETEVMFTLTGGNNVFVKRYTKHDFIVKQYGSQAECDNAKFEYYQSAYDRMEVAGVRTSLGNMKLLGMSSRVLTEYKQFIDAGRPPKPATVPKEVPVRRVPIIALAPQESKKRKRPRKFQLKPEVDVIQKECATKVKTDQTRKEDDERFGADNIIESADACTGRVVEDVKFTPQLYRDVCIDGKADVDKFPLHPTVVDLTIQ